MRSSFYIHSLINRRDRGYEFPLWGCRRGQAHEERHWPGRDFLCPAQGVEKGFSTPCKCKSAKAVLHLGHHFLVKWVSWIPHFTARAPSFSEAEGAATLRLPPETRDPPQRGRGGDQENDRGSGRTYRTSQFAIVVQGAAAPCAPLLTGPSPAFIRHWRRRDAALEPAKLVLRIRAPPKAAAGARTARRAPQPRRPRFRFAE